MCSSSLQIGTASPGNYKLNVAGAVNAYSYATNGTDYAEFVPKLNMSENITAGDIVGIREGKATKNTTGATTIMVVSDLNKAGIIANGQPYEVYIIEENQTYSYFNETLNQTMNATRIVNITKTKAITDFTNYTNVPVAFVGQVKVKINGTVNDGDWIIPLGNSSGLGKAVDIESATSLNQVLKWIKNKICVSWETNIDAGVKSINCAMRGI